MNNKKMQPTINKLHDTLYQIELFDTYGALLKKQQARYHHLYYGTNLTYDEIAKKFRVSRSAVGDTITRTCRTLLQYEKKLQFLALKHKRILFYETVTDEPLKQKLLALESRFEKLC